MNNITTSRHRITTLDITTSRLAYNLQVQVKYNNSFYILQVTIVIYKDAVTSSRTYTRTLARTHARTYIHTYIHIYIRASHRMITHMIIASESDTQCIAIQCCDAVRTGCQPSQASFMAFSHGSLLVTVAKLCTH